MPNAEDLPGALKPWPGARRASCPRSARTSLASACYGSRSPASTSDPDQVTDGDAGDAFADPVMARRREDRLVVGAGAVVLAGMFHGWRGLETSEPSSVAAPSYANSRAVPALRWLPTRTQNRRVAYRDAGRGGAARPADVPPPTIKREVYAVLLPPCNPRRRDRTSRHQRHLDRRHEIAMPDEQGNRVDIRMMLVAARLGVPRSHTSDATSSSTSTPSATHDRFELGSGTVEVAPDGDRIQDVLRHAERRQAALPRSR